MRCSAPRTIDQVEFLIDLLSDAADGAFVVGEDLRIVFWNRSATTILGLSPSEAMDRPCYEVLRGLGESGEMVCSPSCRLMSPPVLGQSASSLDLSVCTSSGARLWVSFATLTGPPIRWRGWALIHLFHSVHRQKRMEEFTRHVISDAHEFIETAAAQGSPDGNGTGPPLTRREQEVLRLLVNGESMAGIADTLGISIATARGHTQRILEKLGLHSRVQAVVYALQHGMGI